MSSEDWVLEERRERESGSVPPGMRSFHRRVYVVMGNDYPDAVFTTEAAAEAYCTERAAEDPRPKLRSSAFPAPRVYWRYYDFPLLTEIPAKVPPSVVS